MPQDCDVDRLLTDHPNILAMDVPALFEDLRAVFPTRDPADVLRANPKIAYQVRRRSATRNFFFLRAASSFLWTRKERRPKGRFVFRDAHQTRFLFVPTPPTQLEKNTPSAWPLR